MTPEELAAETESDLRDAADALRSVVAKARATVEAQAAIDAAEREAMLARFAERACLSLDAIRAMPDEPRMRTVEHDWRGPALASARVPADAIAILVDGPRDTPALLSLRAKLAAGNTFAVLGGSPGTGKTIAACAAVLDDCRRIRRERVIGAGPVFFTAEEIVSPEGGLDAAETAKRASLLVLDEMGDETLTDVGMARLRAVLSARYAARRPTVATTNLHRYGAGEWAARYGERLDDRVCFIGCDGESMRSER